MGNFDATIITGSLDSKELENSINKLVASVEEKTNSMAASFENSIAKIKASMASLNGMNIMSNAGAAKQTKRNIEETTIAYDKLAMAMQKAMQPKSAEQSFYTFIQQYREHAAQLARDIKNMPSQSLDRQMAEYQRFEVEISNVQRKIQELRTQLNDVARNPNATRFDVKAITDQIGIYENQIKQLTTEQIRSTRRIADEDNATMANKRALYEKTIQLVRELTSEQNNSTNAAKAQIDVQDQLTRKIQRQAEIIRQRMQESGSNSAIWGNAVIYKEGAGSKLSIEEQLLQAHQRQVSLTQERINAEQRENQIKKENVGVAQQQVQVEQQVTQTMQQRGSANNTTQKTFKTYEDFAQALAHVLGVQRNEIKLANEETASYEKLQATLRTLQSVYNKLSNSERNSDNGKALIASIHEVERAMQKIRSQSTRPINLQSVLNLPTKTLDDIAYKIRMLQNYRNGLDFTKQINEINQVNSAINDLQRKQNALIGTTRRWSAENDILGRSLDYIKNRLAFMFTVGASTAFVKKIYEIRGQYELLERSMGILVDSMQQGSQIFAELNAMAIKSPFTTMELGAAAKQLTAYDIAAKDVVDVTRRLADMAAAVGVPIERLTYALGQIKAYGYLNTRDARMFANAGIPLVQELADRYTELEGRLVSVGDVYDRIKKKAISFDDVMDVVNNITNEGGRFFNFQEKAADTLKVKIANLTLAYNNMLNEMGKSHQAILTAPLVALKTLLEHWRNIDNALSALVYTFGAVKVAQIAYYVWWRKASLAAATATATNLAFARTLTAIKASLAGMMTNPFGLAIAGLTILGSMLAKTYLDYRDLQEANKAFNNSIAKNAEENINSIDKFFDEYKKQLDGIGGESVVIQQKMWERIKEEIEKTSKSARTYLDILDNIGNVSDRIQAGRAVLEQINEINKEAKNLAERGLFNVGGGFGDDSLAEKLKEQEEIINKMVVKYGSLKKAQEAAVSSSTEAGMGVSFSLWDKYQNNITATEKELEKFVSVLDKADIKKIMGEGTNSAQLANIREFASIIRDNFLATERGQKISIQGRSMLNKYLDEWIAKQGKANKLIGDERAKIEANRSAWETFFEQLNEKDKQRLDYIVSTNQTKSKAFQEIWDKATKNMEKNAAHAYDQIQSQIAELRNTPDIIIKVIYRESKEELDAQQKQFEKDFLTPKGKGALAPDDYFKEQKRLREKYGRFQKKEGEDNVEWEKRLGETYRNNSDSLKKLNAQIAKSAEMSNVDKTAKIAERDALKEENKALDEIAKKQGFNYEKDKKNKGSQKDLVLEALKNEIDLIKKAQSEYEKLTKDGASANDALATLNGAFGKTVTLLNSRLASYGLPLLDLKNVVKGNPKETLAFLEKISKALTDRGLSNLERMKVVEVAIEEFKLKVKSFDLKEITKGFEDAIKRLKGEFELAMQLDENPELGNMFANMLGVNIETLPRTISAYETAYTKLINKFLKDKNANIELPHLDLTNDDLRAFEEMKKGGALTEEAYEKISQAVNDVRDKKKKDFDETRKEYEALIKKYGEYEAKIKEVRNTTDKERLAFAKKFGSQKQADKATSLITNIQIANSAEEKEKLRNQLKELVADIARGDDTKIRLQTSIDMKSLQEEARINFEEYQKTPEWVLATGNISDLTHNALSKLIADLEQYKKKAKYLDDKQIKKINNALISLHKQIRKDNPFLAMGDSMDEARERMSLFQPELDTIMKQIVDLEKEIGDGEGTDKQLKKLADLKKRWKEVYDQQQAYGKVAATTIVKDINNAISVAKQASSAFNEMAEALGGKGMTEAAQTIKDVTGILEKGGEGAAAGAQIGDGYGAIIGAAAGVLQGVITTFADRWSGNAAITEKIVESQREVKKLTLLYKQLENAIDDAYGQGEIRANQLLIANKKLQLAELETQLELEKSRKSKNRDDDKILELQGQVNDAKQELKELAEDITENFLNISSVKDAVSSMIDGIITALKNGENAMDSFTDSWEEMCWNMIKQVISTEILAPKFKKIFDEINEEVSKRGEKASDDIVKAKEDYENNKEYVQKWSDWYVRKGDEFKRAMNYYDLQKLRKEGWVDSSFNEWDAAQQRHIKDLEDAYIEATSWTLDDVERYAELLKSMQGDYEAAEEATREAAERLGLRMGDKAGNLSALQAGIQGITEDTAGAIEAYMNILNQKVFYHGTILEQIRDTLVGFDLDLSLGVQSQMLLQLQNSYQTQMAIQNLLEGTLTPNGRAFMVELNS